MIFEFGETISTRLFWLRSAISIRSRIGFVDNVAIINLSKFSEDLVQLFLGHSLIDVSDVKAGILIRKMIPELTFELSRLFYYPLSDLRL